MFARIGTAGVFAALAVGAVRGQTTTRISVSSAGVQGNGYSGGPAISGDGRYVAFFSNSTNLVPDGLDQRYDVFLRDRLTGATERIGWAMGGASADGWSGVGGIAISPDGRFVAFESSATNLVPGDTNGRSDIFVRDRLNGTTERVSVATGGAEGDEDSEFPSISADGRFVAFMSFATNLVAGDANGCEDVFVHDRQTGTTEIVSLANGGEQGNFGSRKPSISADGRYVAFTSEADNLVPGDTSFTVDVFVRDRLGATTEIVSARTGETQPRGGCDQGCAISADGRWVAFSSGAAFDAGDTNGLLDVFVRDRKTATTEIVSLSTGGVRGDDLSLWPSISADGRFVAFESSSRRFVDGDTGYGKDIFVRDRQNGTTERASIGSGGAQANADSRDSAISGDGRIVAFRSSASNLVLWDTNAVDDVFVRDRPTNFTTLCSPGSASVASCPCANPPSGPSRGCNNSAATGGASLSASGAANLSMDSLVFTTSHEKPTALSVVLQGTAVLSSGVAYGQGVRCVGGTLKRLYTKVASGGAITAPDFGIGDMTVSAVSAALGVPISAGETRWYLVFYRDPVVLGGCPAGRTFNATQTGSVTWWP